MISHADGKTQNVDSQNAGISTSALSEYMAHTPYMKVLDDVDGIIDPFEIADQRFDIGLTRNTYYESMKVHVFGVSQETADAITERSRQKNIQDQYESLKTRCAGTIYPYGTPAPIVKDGSIALVIIPPKNITVMREPRLLERIDKQTERRLYAFLLLCRTAGYLQPTNLRQLNEIFYGSTQNLKIYSICTTITKCFKEAGIPEGRRFISKIDLNLKIRGIQIVCDEPKFISSRDRLEAISLLDEFARGPSR